MAFRDLTGKTFGKLIVIKRGEKPPTVKKGTYWLCECSCGNKKSILATSLIRGKSKSCGCYHPIEKISARKDITGKKFGTMTAIAFHHRSEDTTFWTSRCDCGREYILRYSNLLNKARSEYGCSYCRKKKNLDLPKYLYQSVSSKAGFRGLDWKIDLEDFRELITKKCFYCGKHPENRFRMRDLELLYNGLDRVDNSLGYIKTNVVPCCKKCNEVKKAMSQQEFYDWIDRVYNHIHREDK